jgi:hypothetical protein
MEPAPTWSLILIFLQAADVLGFLVGAQGVK